MLTKELKLRLLNLLDTIEEAAGAGLSVDVCSGFEAFSQHLSQNIEDTHFSLYESSLEFALKGNVTAAVDNIRKKLNAEKTKLEIVFLPYKASMWDSMDSIYRAAIRDETCDVYVVPIPYFERNPDFSLGERFYEGEDYPKDIPVVHYTSYNFSERLPEIVYIHSCYDGNNLVTTIDPEFYIKELKKHCRRLIYVPYFITLFSNFNPDTANIYYPIDADRIILPHTDFKKALIKSGFEKNKLIAVGSPKIDFAAGATKKIIEIPPEWQTKTCGKKVVLVETTLGPLLRQPDYWMKTYSHYLKQLIKDGTVTVIFRPHPLFLSTLKSMLPEFLQSYRTLLNFLQKSEYVIIDEYSNYSYAFAASDIMLASESSISLLYLVTGKPIFKFEMYCGEECDKGIYYFISHEDDFCRQLSETDNLHIEFYRKMKRAKQPYLQLYNINNCFKDFDDILKENRAVFLQKNFANVYNDCGTIIHSEMLIGLPGL